MKKNTLTSYYEMFAAVVVAVEVLRKKSFLGSAGTIVKLTVDHQQ